METHCIRMTPLLKVKLLILTLVVSLAAHVNGQDVLHRRDCGKRYHLENGYVDFSEADTTLEATVTCNPGYKAGKTGKIYCGSDGFWTDETCVPKDCKNETTVKNGKVTYGNFTIFGELAEVTCDTGYKLDGHPYLICQEDGKWNSNTTCVTVDCGMDYKIPHGHVLFKGKDTTYNKKFDVTCEKGYELAGEKQTTCLADGKWSKHTACLPVECGTQVYLENGYADFTDVETTYNQKLPVYCHVGYFRQGNDYFICDENSTWSWPEDIRCNQVHCKTNHSIAHSQANFTSRSTFIYGEVVPVYCDSGYYLVGGPFATCQANGEWSDTRCEPKDCGMEYDLEFGTVTFDERWTTYRSKASVTCHDGYRIHGEESLTCLASGKWSTLTKCVIHVCETVYELENGYVDFFQAEVSYKKKANVSCNEGYFVDGDEQVECLKDGKWSKTKCSDNILSDKSKIIMAGCGAGVLLAVVVIITFVLLKRKQMLCFAKKFKL